MISISPSKHGRPGDLMFASPPAVLAISALEKPDTKFLGQGVYSLGLELPEPDLRQTVQAMREAFRVAYPQATGTLKLPVRQDKRGVWLMFAETTKVPIVIDAEGKPVPPPSVGSMVRLLARICPFHRPDRGRQGVALYINKIKLAPTLPSAPT